MESRGGFEGVCKTKKWAEIGRDMGYSGKIMSSLSTSLKNSYQRWLQPYEQHLRKGKPGSQQQDLENGDAFTQSARQSPITQNPSVKSNPGPSSSKPVAAPVALKEEDNENIGNEAMPTIGPGFTAVNQASKSAASAVQNGADKGSFTPPRTSESTANGHSNYPTKRALSIDSSGGGSQTENGDGDSNNGRRSKRLKKGVYQLE